MSLNLEHDDLTEHDNTTYNVIDTLMYLDRGLWDAIVELWSSDAEKFINECDQRYTMRRTVAYTYWHAIWFGMEHGYPLQFHPGNIYYRTHPHEALEKMADILR